MSHHRTLNATLIRFALAGAVALAALFAISSLLLPHDEDPPEVIEHRPNEAGLVELTNEESATARADLEARMTDQEISRLSADAVAAVAPAVVVVHRNDASGNPVAIGSGVAISASGHILASLGTTGEEGTVQVTWPGGVTVEARVVRIDQRYQVALLQTEAPPEAVATLAQYPPRSGDRILAIGSPLEDFTSTITGGVIGALGVTFPAGFDRPEIPDLIQHDAAVNDGNEGGPIVDLNGNVVGINVGSITQVGNEDVQGWSFAVPISALVPLLAELD